MTKLAHCWYELGYFKAAKIALKENGQEFRGEPLDLRSGRLDARKIRTLAIDVSINHMGSLSWSNWNNCWHYM